MRTIVKRGLLALGLNAAVFAFAAPANAGMSVRFQYHSAPADVRVWLEPAEYYYQSDYDVYASVNDVVLSVRASRNTYATVYVVDTEGFIHVVHPFTPGESAFLYGGRVYQFRLSDMGFSPWQFDRGVAFAYAVTSPVPFSFAAYDVEIFGPRWGLRIVGDPYVASRQFYASVVPAWCDPALIGISHARFYVREYTRYPGYLCVGWHESHGTRTYCRSDCTAFRYYRIHAGDPIQVLHPRKRLKRDYAHYTSVRSVRHSDAPRKVRSVRDSRRVVHPKPSLREHVGRRDVKTINAKHRSGPIRQQPERISGPTVVRSSKGEYVRSRKNIAAMRDELQKREVAKKTSGKVIGSASSKKGDRVAMKEESGRNSKASTKKNVR